MKILIIDDNADITDAMSMYIESQGIDCTVSNQGMNGLELIKQNNFDLIILDIAMPEFSGYDVIESLKNDQILQNHKIIVLTASSLTENAINDIKLKGIQEVVKKPLALEQLQDLIDKYK